MDRLRGSILVLFAGMMLALNASGEWAGDIGTPISEMSTWAGDMGTPISEMSTWAGDMGTSPSEMNKPKAKADTQNLGSKRRSSSPTTYQKILKHYKEHNSQEGSGRYTHYGASVLKSYRKIVIARSQYRCKFCRYTYQLQVVPSKMLRNGGNHNLSGLIAVCSQCVGIRNQIASQWPPSRIQKEVNADLYPPASSRHDAYDEQSLVEPISGSMRNNKLVKYFQEANVGVLGYMEGTTPRDVSKSIKDEVLRRDGYSCIICGTRKELEVDHSRALMNGGSNSISNLATLCRKDHRTKTRWDRSLLRKRKKLYGIR